MATIGFVIRLEARTERIPPDNSGKTPAETGVLEASGTTYEEARAVLYAQLPDGWRLVWIRQPQTAQV